jgi:hypothetical protein
MDLKDQAAASSAAPLTLFAKVIVLPEVPTEAVAVVTCDTASHFTLTAKRSPQAKNGRNSKVVDLKSHLVKGENLLAAMAVNESAPPDKKTNDKTNSRITPGLFLFYARVNRASGPKKGFSSSVSGMS